MLKIKTTFDMGDVMQRLEDAKENTLDYIDAELLLNFYATTATWDTPVDFRVEKSNGRHAVGTDSERYEQLNNGFVREVALSADYQRKTIPGVLASFPGQGRVIGDLIFGVPVTPGLWDEANAKEVEPMAGPIAQQEYGKLFK
jgi:hypothetical protein